MNFKFNDYNHANSVWRNSGKDFVTGRGLENKDERMSINDAIAVPNAMQFLPRVLENIVKEAVEPLLVGTSLLQKVEYRAGITITFPAVGALTAADIAEGQSYPEVQLQIGGATVTASIGKVGLAVKITEEMVRYSQFDVINLHLRAAGRALARHKEKKIFNFISAMGTVAFDNANPTNSLFGVTHGRDLDGSPNGSIVMDDIFDAWGQIISQGFMPNTLLMHPLTWVMFVKDATLRAFALASGGGTFFASHSGNPVGRAPWDASNQGKMGLGGGREITPGENAAGEPASPLSEFDQTINSAPNLPNYLGIPFRIIVSPFVRYDTVNKLTDILMFDSNELGALIEDEAITTDEWNDQSTDIRKIKFRERYGIGIFNEGQGIVTMKNIKLGTNQIVLPAQSNIDISGSVSEIPMNTPVV
jgi:hypothetical protein